MTASRMCATPASIDDGCAWMVVERAYTIHPFPLRGSAPGGATGAINLPPPDYLWQWATTGVLARDRRLEMAGHRPCPVGWSGEYRCAGCGHRASPYRRFDRVGAGVLLSAGRRTLQHLRPARDSRGGDHRDRRRLR